MSSSSIEFHKICIEQCVAAGDIRDHFGADDALACLIGDRLDTFLMASERDPLFTAEVQAFVAEIRQMFSAAEIRDYPDHLERCPNPDLEIDDADDEIEDELWSENPVIARLKNFFGFPVFDCRRSRALILEALDICSNCDRLQLGQPKPPTVAPVEELRHGATVCPSAYSCS